MKFHKQSLICMMFLLLSFFKSLGQKNQKIDSMALCENYQFEIELGVEYFYPVESSNRITTITTNGFYWRKYFKNAHVLISAGVTANYAWGYSNQWYPVGPSAYSKDFKTSAFGAGPVFQIAPTIVKIRRVSLIAVANGGVMFYDKHFPYGGDFYNFMFRTGPSVVYRFHDHYALQIGYRWMHVSNGQGMGNQNPFYEAQGICLAILLMK